MFNSTANKFLFNLAQDRPIYVLASLVFSLSSAVFNAIGTIFLIPIAMMVFGNSLENIFLTSSPIVKYLFDFCDSFDRDNRLLVTITISAIAFIFSSLTRYGSHLIGIKQTKYLTYRMKTLGFGLLAQVDLDYYSQHKVSDLLFKLNREIDKTALFIKGIQNIFFDSIKIIFFTLLLLFISVPLTLIAFGFIVLVAFANYYLIIHTKQLNRLLSQKSKAYNRIVIDFLVGILSIKTNGNEAQEYNNIIQSIQDKNKSESKVQQVSALIQPFNEVATILTVLCLIIASYYLYNSQLQFAPILSIYLAIFFRVLPIIKQLNNTRIQIINNQASVEIVAKFLSQIYQSTIISGKTIFTQLNTSIEFQNVSFAYPRYPYIVLNKINIQIFKGQTIALVGSTGAGKSTITSLLLRLYDPIEGQIIIDGQDSKTYDLVSLRKNISLITEDTFLFNNSLKYNLTYGLKNISESEIFNAIEKTNLSELIAQLPQGLDTNINNALDTTISKKQKQLIAITRALLCDPEIVILDISTDSSDIANQKLIQNALNKLCCDRTTIVITNQVSTVEKADQIIILNKGKIIESGTHRELLKKGKAYQRMCSAQFKTSQQSHQQKLAKRISKRLTRQTNNNLSSEIRNNLNTLLNYLQLVNNGTIEDDGEQEKILDESYQSAKNMLASLKEYEKKISRGFKKNDQ